MNLRDLLKILITLCSLCLVLPVLYMSIQETIVIWMVLAVMLGLCADIFLIILYLIIVIEESDYDDQYVKMSADRKSNKR